MRRILLVLSVAALMAAMMIAPGVAAAQPNTSQGCKDQVDFGLSHGGCVSHFQTEDQSAARESALCKHPFGEVVFPNHGQCVKEIR
jgi:hypothetical protein